MKKLLVSYESVRDELVGVLEDVVVDMKTAQLGSYHSSRVHWESLDCRRFVVYPPEVHIQNRSVSLHFGDCCIQVVSLCPVLKAQRSRAVVCDLQKFITDLRNNLRMIDEMVESRYQCG